MRGAGMWLSRRTVDTFIPLGVVFVAYFFSAKLGQYLYTTVDTFPALIWPPAGVAVAAVLLGGYRVWPAILLASFAASITGGFPLLTAVGLAVGNVLQPIAATYLLRRVDFDPLLSRLRDAVSIIFVALVATTITPTIGLASYVVSGVEVPNLTAAWVNWWAGGILSVIILTPFLVRWLYKTYLSPRSVWDYTEIGLVLGLLLLINYLIFWTSHTQIGGIPLVYLLLIPLFWSSLRLGPRITTLALLITAVYTISGIMFGPSAAASTTPVGQRLFLGEIFLGIIAVIFLLLMALVEERKEVTKILRRHVERLEHALIRISNEDRAKNEFLALLAHELRNPLAPIVSSVELIKARPDLPGDTGKWVNTISNHTQTLVRLVDDLLDTSRISKNKLALQKEVVDLHPILERSMQVVEPLVQHKAHTLHAHLPPSPLSIEADPVRLEQIVVNILTNAAKYTDPGGTITLSVESAGTVLTITVTDTGRGIPRHMLEKIFEPFQQILDMKHQSGGMGIGLSLTKYLTEMHGGTIAAHSDGPGTGSTFTARLPVVTSHTASAAPASQAPTPKASSSRRTILITDDNEAAATSLGALLALRGHEVLFAFTGAQALAKAGALHPELILLDIGLPDMSGLEVARTLRAHGSRATLVALTGYGGEEDKAASREAGCAYHLVKPIGVADVERILADL